MKALLRTSPVKQPTNPYLVKVMRSLRGQFASVFLFSFFINLFSLTVPLYLLQIYDKVLPGRNLDTLIILTMIVLIAVLALGALEAIRRSILAKLGTRFDYLISDHLLNSAIRRTIVKSRASVNIMRDLASLRGFISNGSILPLLDVPWTPLFVLFMYLLHPLIGFVGLVGCLIMVSLAIINERATRAPVAEANAESRDLLERAHAWIRNADVVQAMGMQGALLGEWKQRNANALTSNYLSNRLNTRLSSLSKMVKLFLQIAVVCTAAWLIIQQQLTPGITIASILLMRRAIAPLEGAIRSWKSVLRARSSYQNISEYLDHASSLESDSSMPVPAGALSARRVSFRRSSGEKSVFSSVNMDIKPGRITALTGPTAAGKSTLLRVIAGIVEPNSGRMSLGGFELAQWTPEQLGPHIGFMPQDVCLFPGTVRGNINRFTDGSIDDVIAAAELAGAHNMIQQLPDGYETNIVEDGLNLSGGQRQRIGLARAVFGSPCVVILDEPDAALDSPGRSQLRKTLRELRRSDVAVLITTHHSSVEKVADTVYHLEAGKLTKQSPADKDPVVQSDSLTTTELPLVASENALNESTLIEPEEALESPVYQADMAARGGVRVSLFRQSSTKARNDSQPVSAKPSESHIRPITLPASPEHSTSPTAAEIFPTQQESPTAADPRSINSSATGHTSNSATGTGFPQKPTDCNSQQLTRLQKKLARRRRLGYETR